jgi:hypothetical protein
MSTPRWLWAALCVAGCGEEGAAPGLSAPASGRTPEVLLREGQPQLALRALRIQPGDIAALRTLSEEARVTYTVASLDTGHWGDAEAALPTVESPAHRALLGCYLAGRRGDIDATRRCELAVASTRAPGVGPVARASGQLGLALALEHDHRWDEAAAALKAAVAEAGDARNQRMLMDFYERQGWIAEAVATLETWHQATPGDATITDRLAKALERKVRGDLLEKRGPEAEAAARRLMAVVPAKAGTWRFYLADALALRGDTAGAERERAAAKASGAPEPKRPDAVRELDPAARPPGAAATPGPAPGAGVGPAGAQPGRQPAPVTPAPAQSPAVSAP